MRTLALVPLLVLFGCPGGGEKEVEPIDADGDTYFSVETGGDDCDDADAAVNPGATEVCGGADEDCDGAVDDADDGVDPASQSAWYPDADADTYGGDAGEVLACVAPEGHIAAGGDCDDARADVNPAGAETCDEAGADEDCDGLANDDDASVGGQAMWYPDDDGDGYGALTGVVACFAPEGSLLSSGDCDDARADVNPAGTEACDPADADEDCDGLSDDADDSVTGTVAWYPDADGDGWGGDTAVVRCDALPGETANAGDCDDDDAALNGDDGDGDGESTCDGDCDDDDVETTSLDCSYTSMVGTFDIPAIGCSWDTVGTALPEPVVCTDCEFAFNADYIATAGSCLTSFTAEMGWDEDALELSFGFYYSELGPFPGTLTAGSGYDILEWSGYSSLGYYTYEGTFFLYR